MNDIVKMVLSMSISGSLLILVLFLCKPFYRNRISKRWQYYIWLVVIARLLLPFAPEQNLMRTAFERAEQMTGMSGQIGSDVAKENDILSVQGNSALSEGADDAMINESTAPISPQEEELLEEDLSELQNEGFVSALGSISGLGVRIAEYLGFLWLGVAVLLLIRKITAYQSFVKYIKASRKEVSDVKLLDLLAETGEKIGIKKPVELYVNNIVSSPLLLGFFRPCIVLPTADLSETDFRYTVCHELIHYKRCDMLYKWLVQITVCLHWFNPFVWLMGKETGRACEFACDEAVIGGLGEDGRKAYGDTLMHAVDNGGTCREPVISAALSESGELLKERLQAILHFKKKSKLVRAASLVLAAALTLGAAITGVAAPVKLPGKSDSTAGLENAGYGEKDLQAGEEKSADAIKSSVEKHDEVEELFVKESADGGDISMETLDVRGTTYYLVFNEAQLRTIGTGKYGLDKNYMQQADIQMSTEEWIPIGTREEPFTGSYNGNGYEIIGLTMTDPDADLIGLFGAAKDAEIYNITLRDYDIMSAGRNATGCSVGAIAAITRGGSGGGCRIYDNVVYPKEFDKETKDTDNSKALSQAEKYYKNDSLPGFGRAFDLLDDAAKKSWLEKIYHDEEIAFFSVALSVLDEDSPLFDTFAGKAYADGKINFFSVLTDYMGKDALEDWLDQSIQERQVQFQMVLLDALDRDWELEALEAELEKQRMEEYRAFGITNEGKRYYYKGQLVDIFLDMPENKSFYTLNMNPDGVVNIKVVRDADGKIKSVAYMTDEEVEKGFGNAKVVRGASEELPDDWEDSIEWEDFDF